MTLVESIANEARGLRLAMPNIVLFGPPGSGKSVVGRELARILDRPFLDTDALVETKAGKSVAQIFEQDGESAFRSLEILACEEASAHTGSVIACGGGSLLSRSNRQLLEASGTVICLSASPEILQARLASEGEVQRPVLEDDSQDSALQRLLIERQGQYESFEIKLDTTMLTVNDSVEAVRGLAVSKSLAMNVRQGDGYQVHLGAGLYEHVAELVGNAGLEPPFAIVSDSDVAPLYVDLVDRWLGAPVITFPAGEAAKNIRTVERLYDGLHEFGMERRGTVLALGGGVVGDVAGFAAASYLRGVRWVGLPTSLLAMVDSSIGGKVGVDRPQGKNLVGAFHPPRLVIADTDTLDSLPQAEWRSGMAETVKAGVIGDPQLFDWIERGLGQPSVRWIERAIQVKIKVIETDPTEQGLRASLNLGHTVGHGIETASNYELSHGEAIAVGMIAEARLAEALGLAEVGISARIAAVFQRLGLPTVYCGPTAQEVRVAMESDKKRQAGKLKFSLPATIGEIRLGVVVPERALMQILESLEDCP